MTPEQQRIADRNARLDALSAKLEELTSRELDRIDKQVALLRRVREGRGAGKLKARADLHMQELTVEKISDFLG